MTPSQVTLEILFICGMGDFKLGQKLAGLQDVEDVGTIRLIRRRAFEGSKIVSYPVPGCISWSRVFGDLCRFCRSVWLCARHKPNVIVAFYLYYHGIMGWVLGRLFGVPVVQALIGTDLERAIRSNRMMSILKSAAAVAVNGAVSRDRLVGAGLDASKISYPTSAFSIHDFPVAGAGEREYDLIFVGALVAVKRVDRILRLTARLKANMPGVRVAVLGGGRLRARLERQARDLGVDRNVKFLGAVSGSEVPAYLDRSKIFIMTSETEGLPMAAMEALSCGLPVILPDVGDVRCVVRNGENGMLVDPADEDALLKTCLELLTDDDKRRRLGDGAVATRERFEKDYSRQAVRSVWEGILDRVCARGQ